MPSSHSPSALLPAPVHIYQKELMPSSGVLAKCGCNASKTPDYLALVTSGVYVPGSHMTLTNRDCHQETITPDNIIQS